MKKPMVDYTQFRVNKINEPQYSHLKLLLGWVIYFIFYFLTENLIPVEKCHIIWCRIDDLIPFNEYFFIPYTFWYVLIVISLGWFALYDVENFKNLSVFIMVTQVVAMIAYICYPSVQYLRPETFVRHNFFTCVAGLIYHFDTPTGVCPSLHVAYSLGIASCWLKEKKAHPLWKVFVTVACLIICIATAFVKQHSFVDIIAAIPVAALAEFLVFGPARPYLIRERY